MSHLGHSRPKWAVRAMSGSPPIATELRTSLEVRFVPRAEVGDLLGDLFDYLVGQQLERVRHGEAEGGGGLEINDQFVFERELNGQIARI